MTDNDTPSVNYAPGLEHLMVPIDSIKPHPRNAKLHDVEEISGSIEDFSFADIVVVQKSSGYVIAGHGRLQALTKLGASEVPALFVDLDDEDAGRFRLRHNASHDAGGYDKALLASVLQEYRESERGLEATGYTDVALDELLEDLTRAELDEESAGLGPGGDAEEEDLSMVWGVIISTTDEEQQVALLERFQAEGLNCRAVMSA